MYCPGCGFHNQNGIKFCTRCGTNLAAVSHALADETRTDALDDEAKNLIKDYYKGRRNLILSVALIVGGIKLFFLLLAAGLPGEAAAVFTCWLFFWGIPLMGIGLSQFLNAKGEMRALRYDLPSRALPRPVETREPVRAITERLVIDSGERVTTEPMMMPSVTEETTRRLEDQAHAPPVESQSK